MAKKTNIRCVYMLMMICFLAMPFVLLLLLRGPICSGKMFPSARQYVEMFFPPADLYRPVLDEKINNADIERPYTFKFKLKYVGRYSVDIALYGLDDRLYGTEYDHLKLRIKINLYKNKVLLLSVSPTDKYDKTWVSGRGKGVTVGQFVSPEEVPIDTDITCEVVVLTTDPYLAREPRLLIGRQSEE